MTPPMTRASPPRLASLGMLVWWAATSSAMPPRTPAGAPYEADGPDAHKLSLQPVGRSAHLDFERRRDTTCSADGEDAEENRCCHIKVDECSDYKYAGSEEYGGSERNCHMFYRVKKSALFPPCRRRPQHARVAPPPRARGA